MSFIFEFAFTQKSIIYILLHICQFMLHNNPEIFSSCVTYILLIMIPLLLF